MDSPHFTRSSKRAKSDKSILNNFSYTDSAIQNHNKDLELFETNIDADDENTARREIADMESAEHEDTVHSILTQTEVSVSTNTEVPSSELKCRVQDCIDKDKVFDNVASFLEHHNRLHSMKPISRNRLLKLQSYHCGKCSLVYQLTFKLLSACCSNI